jgi:hypothetical protein
VEVKEQYQAKISQNFAALKIFDDYVDISRTWENIRISEFQPKRVWVMS